MTILADTPVREVETPNGDLLPGSTDVEWAEEAFRRARADRTVRAVPRPKRRLLRAVIVAAVLFVALLTIAIVTQSRSATSGPTHLKPVSTSVVSGHSARGAVDHGVQIPILTRPSIVLPFEPPSR